MTQFASLETMVRASARQVDFDASAVADALSATLECMALCTMCADACAAEESNDALKSCIRMTSDCADLCGVSARLLCRTGKPDVSTLRATLEATVHISTACATECEKHAAEHDHCKLCAEACRAAARACHAALEALTEGPSS